MDQTFNDNFYKLIAEEALMAIITLTKEGKCVYANHLAQELLECPNDFDKSQFSVELLYPKSGSNNRIRAFSKEVLDSEGLVQEVLIQKLNGQLFVGSIGIKQIKVQDEKLILLMIQDVTLQKKLQREVVEKQTAITQAYHELLVQNKQLKDLDVAKNRFIAVTTHELRTPLSAMVASAEILKLKLFDTPEQHDEFVDMIYDQGQHLLNLVNDILDFAKIQSNKMDYYIHEDELLPVVKHETEALQTMASASQVELTLEPFDGSTRCYFDTVRIKQVLTNLINNAIKYNKKGGQVRVSIESDDQKIRVYIADTGKGISTENQDKVFNEFETLGKVAHHAKGTGLGLPISQRMIQAMGGDIKLKSEEGVGSTFWIEVPKNKVVSEENYRSRPEDTGSGDLAA